MAQQAFKSFKLSQPDWKLMLMLVKSQNARLLGIPQKRHQYGTPKKERCQWEVSTPVNEVCISFEAGTCLNSTICEGKTNHT